MTTKRINKFSVLFLTWITILCLFTANVPAASAAEKATGVGLSAHCLKGYREGWEYSWGGSYPPYVDCSGLIASYHGVGGIRTDMLYSCQLEGRSWGYVSNGIPNIHGLGLHMPGHVGVYVGSGMAVDARDYGIDMCYESAYGQRWDGSYRWVEWFMITGVEYPTNGWVLLDGDAFYYENGQYLTGTSRTLGGVKYTFSRTGVSNYAPPAGSYVMSDGSVPTGKPAPSVSTTMKFTATLSKQNLLLGNSVTVNCQASGGKAPYTYAVCYRKKGSSKWSTVQNYQKNASVKITPQAAFDYEICAYAKDAAGRIAQQDLNITVCKPLENTSSLTETSIKFGKRTKVTCSATGGTNPYRYAVFYKLKTSEQWTTACTYGTNTSVVIQPSAIGTYDVRVEVMDTRNKVVKKMLTLKVTK